MSAWDIRALLSKVSNSPRRVDGHAPGNMPSGMMRRAGRAMGRALGATQAADSPFDRLEDRTLLDGSFASPLPLTDLGGGQFEAADFINPAVPSTNTDTYSFTATSTGFVSVLADTRNEVLPNTLNTRVRVYNNAQQLVAVGASNGLLTSGLATDGWVGFIAQSGQSYFFVVDAENVGALTTGNTYTLRVNAENRTFDPSADVDPNDATGDIARGMGREAGSAAPVGDPDFFPNSPIPYAVTPILGELARLEQDIVYSYTVPADQNFDSLITINAQVTQDNQAIRLDSRLDIYRVADAGLGTVTSVASDSDSGRRNDAFTTLRVSPGETIYIRVRSDEIRPNAPTTGTGTGSFYLVFDGAAADLPLNPVVRRGSDQNILFNGFLDPTTPPNPNTPKPTFQTVMYKFQAQGTGLAIITFSSQTPQNDPALRVYDDNGNLIAFNNNFQGVASQISVQLIGGRQYFIVGDGFQLNTGRDFQLFVEANHTFDQVTGVDDHIDNPGNLNGQDPAVVQLLLKDATGLRFGQPFDTFDDDGNLVRDLGQKITAVGQGRIEGAGDTDIFRFTAPVDMLSNKAGNNDDLGTSLFVGGQLDFAGPAQSRPTVSGGLVTWDANDFWTVGDQRTIDDGAGGQIKLGFTPRAGGAAEAQVLAMKEYDFDGAGGFNPILFVGGDFTLNFIDPATGALTTVDNIVGWFLNPQVGRYTFIDVTGGQSPDAPVRAFAIFDPVGYDPDGSGPLPTFDDPNANEEPWLMVGGDFAGVGGSNSPGLSFFNGGWNNVSTGMTVGAGGVRSVRALAVYNASDPGPGRTDPAPVIPDPIDPPNSLWIGGVFGGAGTTASANLVRWDGQQNDAAGQPGFATPFIRTAAAPAWAINGAVNALTTWTEAPDPDGPGSDRYESQDVLIIGGTFTTIGGVAANRVASFGWVDNNANQADQPGFGPKLDFIALGVGVADNDVLALHIYDPVDENRPGQLVRAPRLLVGGRFNNAGGQVANNIAQFTWNAAGAPTWGVFTDAFGQNPGTVGINPANPNAQPTAAFGTVRAFTSFVDEQEPSIPLIDENTNQSVLYIGGDFAQITDVAANSVAQFFQQEPGGNPDAFGAGTWAALAPQFAGAEGGVLRNRTAADQPDLPAKVFALAGFDDGNTGTWDRHDRPASTLEVTVAPAEGSFLNSEVRVFDSNFNLVFSGNSGVNLDATPWSTTRNGSTFPNDTSRSGMIDNASTFPVPQQSVIGIPIWGGETYYIEVSGQSTGRYTLTVTVDANPDTVNAQNPDLNPNDVNAIVTDEPDEGAFTDALEIRTTLADGDGDNTVNSNQNNGQPPPNGNNLRIQKTSPFFGALSYGSDLGNIVTIDDTDLYVFRAEFSGTAEIRIQTTQITDTYGQWIAAEFGNGAVAQPPNGDAGTKTYNSQLDSVLRVFRNDFEQVAYNDDNSALQGLVENVVFADDQAPTQFWSRDARVIVPVIAGNFYYIQVESGQRWKDGQAAQAVDRTANIDREIDWRYATGSYRLLVNQMGNNLLSFVENGTEVRDDYPNANAGQGAEVFIPIGSLVEGSTLNGKGSITGVINNPPAPLPVDTDLFSFVAPGSGNVVVDVSRTVGSNLNADVTLLDQFGNVLATGSNVGGGTFRVQRSGVTAGEKFFIIIAGAANSEGGYRIDVTTGPEVDDYADERKIDDAQDIVLRDFAGTGQISGDIEVAGDSDLFRVSVEQFQQMTVTVTATESTLDPVVFLYEMSEDPAGNPVLLLVNVNDDFGAGSTAARAQFSVSPSREKAGPPTRSYPYYYILVMGADPTADFGTYNVTITFPPTDDHADGDTNRDGTIDTPADSPRVDEFDFATPITMDSATGQGSDSGVIEIPVDSDLFVFAAPATGNATITIDRPGTSLLRLRVDVLTATGTLIASDIGDDLAAGDYTASVTFAADRGVTYYIVVRGFEDPGTPNVNTETTGAYTLAIDAQPVDDLPNAGEFDLANATAVITFDPSTGNGVRDAQIGDAAVPTFTQDTDLMTFVAGIAGTFSVIVTPLTTGVNGFAPRIRLIAADQVTVLQDISATSRNEEITTATFSATLGQRFYILVESSVNITGTIGAYEVTVDGPGSGGSGGGGTDPAVVDLPNAPSINLDPRTGDATVNDIIEVANDRDAYKFTTLAAGRVFVQITTPNGSLLNASIQILNAANEEPVSGVVFDADGIPGATANVAFNATTNTTYWIIIDGLGNSTGSYTITVNTMPFVNRLVFPEGYTNDVIREFVSIVNPNPVTATYTLYLRYENTSLPQTIVSSASIGPNARGGVTISDGLNYRTPGVVPDAPYSIVLESDIPLGATLAHYDFGTAIGDSLTEEVSASWTFASVQRNPGQVLDFLTFYNVNNFDVDVTITAYANGQTPVSLSRTFGANRRGGFSINDISNFPTGTFAVVLSSQPTSLANAPQFVGVVASLSHYDTSSGAGFALLGQASASREGTISNLGVASGLTSSLTLFNPNATSATVQLAGSYSRQDLPAFGRTVQVPARSTLTLTGAQLGLVDSQPAAITYTSDVPINAASSQVQRGDADATRPLTSAGTRYFFGDAYIQRDKAGTEYFETLYFYNPTDRATTVTISLLFNHGVAADTPANDPSYPIRNRTFTVDLPAKSSRLVNLHERAEILERPTVDNWFAIDAQATVPFVMTMTHYDLFLGGGWANDGVPLGIVTPLSLIP